MLILGVVIRAGIESSLSSHNSYSHAGFEYDDEGICDEDDLYYVCLLDVLVVLFLAA